jgi:hypothetical protein
MLKSIPNNKHRALRDILDTDGSIVACRVNPYHSRLFCACPDLLKTLEGMVKVFNKKTSEIDPLEAFAIIEKAQHLIERML